jgi:hypothetical protein
MPRLFKARPSLYSHEGARHLPDEINDIGAK